MLADALWYCQDRFKPQFMIDLATLTGAIIVALGHEHAGLFSNNDELAERLIAAGKAVGEKLWRMPLADAYDKLIDSDAADMKNIGGPRRRQHHRRAVPAALRQRRAVGASRHRRHRLVEEGRARPCPRAPPPSACGCSTASSPTITRSNDARSASII